MNLEALESEISELESVSDCMRVCNSKNYVDQYVSDVVDFSSQYGSDISISYSAHNILGKPSKFPAYGDFPQTFVMVSFTLKSRYLRFTILGYVAQ